MSENYKTGLEFLNEAPYAERAQEVRDMCLELGDDIKVSVLDGETLSYMLMEMYNRGLQDGAIAGLAQVDIEQACKAVGVLH